MVYPGIEASVTTKKYGRLFGPSTVQFNIVGLNDVKMNLTRSSGGRGYVVLRYGKAPTMEGGGPELGSQLPLLELTFPAVQWAKGFWLEAMSVPLSGKGNGVLVVTYTSIYTSGSPLAV